MVHKNFERITKRIILTEIFYSWSALNSIKPIFQIFWLYLNICKNDLNLFLNGTNLMCNRIIIYVLFIMPFCFKSLTKRYIFQLIKYEHRGVSRRIDSGNRNFASVKPQQIFHFFLNQNIYSQSALKWIRPIFQIFEYMLRIKIKNKCENEDNLNLFWNRPYFK